MRLLGGPRHTQAVLSVKTQLNSSNHRPDSAPEQATRPTVDRRAFCSLGQDSVERIEINGRDRRDCLSPTALRSAPTGRALRGRLDPEVLEQEPTIRRDRDPEPPVPIVWTPAVGCLDKCRDQLEHRIAELDSVAVEASHCHGVDDPYGFARGWLLVHVPVQAMGDRVETCESRSRPAHCLDKTLGSIRLNDRLLERNNEPTATGEKILHLTGHLRVHDNRAGGLQDGAKLCHLDV